MRDDEDRNQEDCASSQALLSSWAIIVVILVGMVTWTGVQTLTSRAETLMAAAPVTTPASESP